MEPNQKLSPLKLFFSPNRTQEVLLGGMHLLWDTALSLMLVVTVKKSLVIVLTEIYAKTWWALMAAGIIVVHVARQTLFNHDKNNHYYC